MRGVYTSVLVFCSVLVFGQENDIPVSLQVPADRKLIAHYYAKGVQVYVCMQDAKDSTRYSWVFKEPVAKLYTSYQRRKVAGKHFFDGEKHPAWELRDGSKTSGIKAQQSNAPDTTAIPWLLLNAVGGSGSGTLKNVQFIQRIRTKGGKAPAAADKQKKGQTLEVPYRAEYLFYGGK